MSEQTLPERIQNLIGMIDQAITQVEGGEMIDLANLDDEVQAVCEAAENPAIEEMEMVDEKMDEMIGKLEELSDALDKFEHTDEDDEESDE
jgi:hypothetical protein